MKNAIYTMLDDVKSLQVIFYAVSKSEQADYINKTLLNAVKWECDFANNMKFSRFKDMDGSRYIVRLESKHKADIHALYLFFRDNFFPSDFTNVDEEGSILDWEIEVF